MRYFIIAGEASGDLHGSNLIKGIREMDKEAQIRCWGGDLMKEAGAELIRHYKEGAIMGFVEVVANLGKLAKNLQDCKNDIVKYNPDAVILIDYPGFNFRIAKFAKERGMRVFYYIAPKVWAWKEKRVHKLKKYVDRLFIIFPFEIEYFKKWGIDAIYRGNPLLDSVDNHSSSEESKEAFEQRCGIGSAEKTVALLAGSRRSEIKYLLPRMMQVAGRYPEYRFLMACAPSMEREFYEGIIGNKCSNIKLLFGETYSILRHSDAAIISSGTASLEAALIGVPQVVCYGGNEISYQIARSVVKLKYISLANLIMDKGLFKELIQHDCTPQKISAELDNLLGNSAYREKMLADYRDVRNILGGKGASAKVASAMIEELEKMMNKNQ
ncbi:MAG: lipid-A-disaccharide synthase [Bacteroidales bacterium]|nr:lipid-A-disaccharide synthase [Bacteroidales bacterium]MBQ7018942.1 lipid-A-disaccharide synthase [Bacteroidales bacterium]MBR2477437.1 lipid-A-disaccharide synthase [Bacteroidales bacterium]